MIGQARAADTPVIRPSAALWRQLRQRARRRARHLDETPPASAAKLQAAATAYTAYTALFPTPSQPEREARRLDVLLRCPLPARTQWLHHVSFRPHPKRRFPKILFPKILLDGAHQAESLRALHPFLRQSGVTQGYVLLLGMKHHKDEKPLIHALESAPRPCCVRHLLLAASHFGDASVPARAPLPRVLSTGSSTQLAARCEPR